MLVTFHPSPIQFIELLKVLKKLNDVGIIFTKSNADTGGRAINEIIDNFAGNHHNAKAFISLGQLLYLSTIAQVDVVVGNSSNGLYKVPSFKKPTVNIGSRQKGRTLADSVIQCGPIESEIYDAIHYSFSLDCSKVINPYGEGNTSRKILDIIKTIDKNMPGPDHKASLEPEELKEMVFSIRQVEKVLGSPIKVPTEAEYKNLSIARKSLVANRDIPEDKVLSENNITCKRPGNGISPYHYWEVIGERAKRNFKRDEVLE